MERRTLLQVLTAELICARRIPAQAGAHDQLLRVLCPLIVPGALEAGAPEFIDLLVSENPEYKRQFAGGSAWLDGRCRELHGKDFLSCTAREQTEILDLIAYRESAVKDASLAPGVAFFAWLRDLTLDGFFTSRAGIEYLEFRGNSGVREFRGCPGPSS